MSELVAGIIPIVVMWTIPLAPVFYAIIVEIIDTLTASVQRRRDRQMAPNPGTAVLRANAEVR